MLCPICSSSMSEPIEALFALPSVASDCRPWSNGRSVQICSGCGVMKRVTNEDFNPDVYKEYTSYPEPTGRTAKILDFIKDKMSAPKRVLDVGCGKGDGLRILQDYFSDAKVFGYEPTICTERPTGKFDLITLFHVFEHVEDLYEMLTYIKSSLTENGHVLIQVPYALLWPFDLIIADHEWHFTGQSFVKLCNRTGFEIIYFGNKIMGKEITVLIKPNANIYNREINFLGNNSPDWILGFKKKLDIINERVAVYGTSVSAMWTGSILGSKIAYYLDDDINRISKQFNGRNVHSPNWPKMNLPVVAPFPDWQLEGIKEKHPNLKFL